MTSKWTTFKNLGWAIGIVVCLVAVIVGIVIASVNRYSGSSFSGSTLLTNETVSDSANVTELTPGTTGASGTLLTLPETPDAGQEYIDTLTFLCDSSIIGIRDYGLLSGGTGTTQVWGTDTGTLRVSDLAEGTIIYPSDGSSIAIGDAAMIAKPGILVICVGQDGLNAVDEASFKASYSAMLSAIKSASPSTKIICCSISSVTSNYSGADGLTTIMISDANDWIREVCTSEGVYFTDAGKAVGDGTGSVLQAYLSSNGKTLNSGGINEILTHLRTHAVS